MTTKISITRGLATLKLLDQKIQNATQQGRFVGVSVGKGTNMRSGTVGETIDQAINKIKASFDTVDALINNRVALKRAIVASNAVATVVVGGKTMTVAEAIEYKSFIQQKSQLLMAMSGQFTNAKNLVDKHNAQLESEINNLLTTSYGSEKSKVSEDVVAAISEPQRKLKEAALINPRDIESRIAELTKEVNSVATEIDYSLSESNSSTFIEVDLSGLA